MSTEITRVLNIPRRRLADYNIEDLVYRMTEALRTPNGTMQLLPVQALALLEIGMYGRLFGPIRVGSGKTLISLLAPTVLQAWRPLLLIPANCMTKTRDEMKEYAKHFRIPRFIRIESFSMLGLPQNVEVLNQFKPDVIIADESDKLRRKGTARTTRVARYLRANPNTKVVTMTGTPTVRSLKDFDHIMRWTHGTASPLPIKRGVVDEWANALDERISTTKRWRPGALLRLCEEQDRGNDDTVTARNGFRRRIQETPGVVYTRQPEISTPLLIRSVGYGLNASIGEAFAKLRREWMTPDEWPLFDAWEISRHARTLALGFYYRWNPRPPADWYEARKAWAKECRGILSNPRNTLDSAKQVIMAIGRKEIMCPTYQPWKAIEPSFVPNTEAVWLDSAGIEFAAQWAKESVGVVWTSHTAFATTLSQYTGMPFYGEGGLDVRTGDAIAKESGKRSIIASMHSNRRGQNLQAFNRALVTAAPSNGEWWQQLLGRHHRPGQPADSVQFDIVQVCLEHVTAVEQAFKDSVYAEQVMGDVYKLAQADKQTFALDDAAEFGGPLWGDK